MLVYIHRKSCRTVTSYWIWLTFHLFWMKLGSYHQVWLVVVGLVVLPVIVAVLDKQSYSGYCCKPETVLPIIEVMDHCYYYYLNLHLKTSLRSFP